MTKPKKPEPKQPSALVLDFLQRHPDQEVSPKSIGEALDLAPGSVSAALQYLARAHASQLDNVKRGVWVWKSDGDNVASIRPADVAARRVRLQDTHKPTELTDFKVVTTHRSGGVVLKDDNGDLWLAQPIHVEIWPVLNALGFSGGEEQPAGSIIQVVLDPRANEGN